MAKTGFGEQDLSEYALVADRITLFYQRYPAGRIVTELVSRTGREITFRAVVFRGAADVEPAATGWASEREGDGEINQVACLENTETSAVGRALANLGFTASNRRPSREEMEKAARQRARLVPRPAPVEPLSGRHPSLNAEPLSVRHASLDAEPLAARHLPLDADPLQRRANAVHDVLGLIERAEAIGFPEHRGAILRSAVERIDLAPRSVMRLERRIRAWMARHRPHGR
ncbi:MAG TPA: hypothetical protein VJT85_02040 [Gemmatimonadaceae bacterium]|nr:hypothetical protein [Gemmatimonadaceae bacterium]